MAVIANQQCRRPAENSRRRIEGNRAQCGSALSASAREIWSARDAQRPDAQVPW